MTQSGICTAVLNDRMILPYGRYNDRSRVPSLESRLRDLRSSGIVWERVLVFGKGFDISLSYMQASSE
jgi:hypothetical protein